MKAAIFDAFGKLPEIRKVPDPSPGSGSVVLEIKANGVCRSDWHGWMGHDPTVNLPHVPGHEMAGVIAELGEGVTTFQIGDRVTVPFACGCGTCVYCRNGQLHICDNEFQPGFTHWGAFAQLVEIRYAEHNLVRLPYELDFVTAASLGCRFATAYRAIVQQGRVSADTWVAIHGCGGVGLAAVMIAATLGASPIAVDLRDDKLELARSLGARAAVHADTDVAAKIRQLTGGGADVSLDALGSRATLQNSIGCLRKQGRHVQVGLLVGDPSDPPLPATRLISGELEIVGSHGMSAVDYPGLLNFVMNRNLDLSRLVGRTISLDEAPVALAEMGQFKALGTTVISSF